MALQKNIASQKWLVFAFDTTTGAAKLGGAANITANLRKDWAAAVATNDLNPTELEDGYYTFDLLQAETNADVLAIFPQSATTNIQVIGVPAVVLASPANSTVLAISAGGLASADLKQILATTPPATNLAAQYDGSTGLSGDLFPSTQAQVGNLAIGSAAISTVAESSVLTTGALVSGTVVNTETLDSVEHRHSDTAGTLDLYYQFDVTSTGVPVGATIVGRVSGNNDTLNIFAWNWAASAWDQIGTQPGTNSSINSTATHGLLTRHVGTGVNLGKVRIRFQNTGLTTATLSVDQITVAYSSIAQTGVLHSGLLQAATANTATLATSASATTKFYLNTRIVIMSGTGAGQARVIPDYIGATRVATVTPAWTVVPDATSLVEIFPASVHAATMDPGYDNGQVYLDTVNGTTGTLIGVNGTASKPSLTLADALTIKAARNLAALHLIPGSSITLVSDSSGIEFVGRLGAVIFGNQLLSGSLIENHMVQGIINPASTSPFFQRCIITSAGLSMPPGNLFNCSIQGNITCTANGIYSFVNCSSLIPGTTGPILNVQGNGAVARSFNFRHYSGGLEVQNLTATDTISLEGNGRLTVNANSTGGTIVLRGAWQRIDNSGGTVTIILDDDAANIAAILIDTADIQPKIGTPAADVSADIAAVKAETGPILTDTNTTLPAQITALNDFNPASETVTLAATTHTGAVVPTVSTLTGHTPQTGDSFARIGALGASLTGLGGMSISMRGEVNAEVDAALDTALPASPTSGSLNEKVKTNLDATVTSRMAEASINTTAGAVDTVTTASNMRGTDSANTVAPDNASIAAILTDTADMQPKLGTPTTDLAADIAATVTATLPEGYAADGAAFSLAQGLYQIWSFLSERGITGTTQTSKKLDGATAAMTHTLDDASAPTSITRAT